MILFFYRLFGFIFACFLFGAVVRQFIPHRIQYRESGGKRKAESPRKIPHGISFQEWQSIGLLVSFDCFDADFSPKDFVNPACVGQDCRNKNDSDNQHNKEGEMA